MEFQGNKIQRNGRHFNRDRLDPLRENNERNVGNKMSNVVLVLFDRNRKPFVRILARTECRMIRMGGMAGNVKSRK